MTTRNSYLFVGGVKDGTRMCVESRHVEFPFLDEPPAIREMDDAVLPAIIPFKTEKYRLMLFRVGDDDFSLFAEDSMDQSMVLDALISGYRGKGERE